jgi:hypothetical protein
MIAMAAFLVPLFLAAIILLVYIHRAAFAEDARYTVVRSEPFDQGQAPRLLLLRQWLV